jgi:hypothetical protein
MNTVEVRQELHTIIDTLPAKKAKTLLSMLTVFDPALEDDTFLTAEEAAEMDRQFAEYDANPSIATSLSEIKASWT